MSFRRGRLAIGVSDYKYVHRHYAVRDPCIGKSGYVAIMTAYTYASRQNGKKYIPLMKKDSLRVIQKGLSSGVVLDGDFNLLDATYKTSLSKLVNKVVIIDEKGNKVGLVEDAASQRKYGTIQKTYKKEKDEAKKSV